MRKILLAFSEMHPIIQAFGMKAAKQHSTWLGSICKQPKLNRLGTRGRRYVSVHCGGSKTTTRAEGSADSLPMRRRVQDEDSRTRVKLRQREGEAAGGSDPGRYAPRR